MYNQKLKDRICRYYMNGYQVSSIVILTGVSRSLIYKTLIDSDVYDRKVTASDPVTIDIIDKMREMHRNKMPIEEICFKLRYTRNIVFAYAINRKELFNIPNELLDELVDVDRRLAAKILKDKYNININYACAIIFEYLLRRTARTGKKRKTIPGKYIYAIELLVSGLDIITISEKTAMSDAELRYIFNSYKELIESKYNIKINLISRRDIENAYKADITLKWYKYYKKHKLPIMELESFLELQNGSIMHLIRLTGFNHQEQ